MSERTHWDGCWRERTHHECAVARIAELEREIDAVRALMNTYNLGGWTDAVAPMRRALAAEAELARVRDDRDALHAEFDGTRAELAQAREERDALRAENDLLRDPVSPSNLRDLGAYLARLLDEDRWPSAERLLNAALSERHALLDERDALRAKLRAIVEWLERNRPEVWREGIWDAIRAARAEVER